MRRPEDRPHESTSERVFEVGGHGAVDASVFEGFSNTALGHSTGLRRWSETIRYWNTAAVPFSEDHQKSVTVADMDADGAVEITDVNLKAGRKVYSMIGTMDELFAEGTHRRQQIGHPCHGHRPRSFSTPSDSRRYRYHRSPAAVVGACWTAGTRPKVLPDRLDPLETVVAFWTEREHSEPNDAHRRLLAAAVEAKMKKRNRRPRSNSQHLAPTPKRSKSTSPLSTTEACSPASATPVRARRPSTQ